MILISFVKNNILNYLQFYIEIICIFATRKKMVTFPNVQHKWAYLLKNMRKMAPEDEAKETDPIFKKLYEASRLSKMPRRLRSLISQ